MDIQAIFDKAYTGQPSDGVWIIDSPSNRTWFEAAKASLAPNSGLFLAERYLSDEDALCYVIWSIFEHFPDWRSIFVVGLPPTILVPNVLMQEGHWETQPEGFVLHRN